MQTLRLSCIHVPLHCRRASYLGADALCLVDFERRATSYELRAFPGQSDFVTLATTYAMSPVAHAPQRGAGDCNRCY